MNVQLICLISLLFCNSQDTLQLPIKNGKIVPITPGVERLNKAVIISPTNDKRIRSCFDGKVLVAGRDEWGYHIVVSTDSIIIIYSDVDSILVNNNQNIKKGDVIGYKIDFKDNEPYLMFSVFIREQEVDARKYLVH